MLFVLILNLHLDCMSDKIFHISNQASDNMLLYICWTNFIKEMNDQPTNQPSER